MGAGEYLANLRATNAAAGMAAASKIAEMYEGELGFIDSAISHSAMLDRKAHEAEDRIANVVFCYEIAEVFGSRFAQLAVEAGVIIGAAEAEALADKIIAEVSAPKTETDDASL